MKTIPHPQLKSATVLKPADLNRMHFGGKHTKLTPEILAEVRKAGSGNPS